MAGEDFHFQFRLGEQLGGVDAHPVADFVELVGLLAGVRAGLFLGLLEPEQGLDCRVEHGAGRDAGLGLVGDEGRDDDVLILFHFCVWGERVSRGIHLRDNRRVRNFR